MSAWWLLLQSRQEWQTPGHTKRRNQRKEKEEVGEEREREESRWMEQVENKSSCWDLCPSHATFLSMERMRGAKRRRIIPNAESFLLASHSRVTSSSVHLPRALLFCLSPAPYSHSLNHPSFLALSLLVCSCTQMSATSCSLFTEHVGWNDCVYVCVYMCEFVCTIFALV